ARLKLLRLRRSNDDAGDLLRAIGDQRTEIFLERQRAQGRLAQLEDFRLGDRPLEAGHGGLVAAQKRLAQLDATLAELKLRDDAARARRWPALAKIERWIATLPPGGALEMAEPPELPRCKADTVSAID